MSDGNGKLPEGWEWSTLKDIVSSITYGHTASATDEPVGPRFLRITDIQNGSVNWEIVPYCECDDVDKYALKNGDIVIARTGATTGKSFLIGDLAERSVFASYLIRLETLEDLSAVYLSQFMQTPHYWQQITTVSKGSAQPGANASILSKLAIPVSPLPEQRRIVSKIESLQERSSRARRAISEVGPLLEQFRQSVLRAAFQGDLTAEWREAHPDVEPASELLERIRTERRQRWEQSELAKYEAKSKQPPQGWQDKYIEPEPVDESELHELPDGWCWTRWEEVGFCQNGRAFPSKHYAESGVKLLRPGNLHVSGAVIWNESNSRFMPDEWEAEHPTYVVGKNELVMNLTAQSLKDEFLGRVCLTGPDEHCLLNQRIARITPVAPLTPEFCLLLFKSPIFRRYVDTLNTGSLIQHMFTTQVVDFALPLPPLEEHAAIIEAVQTAIEARNAIDDAVAESESELTQLDQSILAKAFRGELVPQDPNDEPASVLLDRIRSTREANNQNGKRPKERKPRSRSSKKKSEEPARSESEEPPPVATKHRKAHGKMEELRVLSVRQPWADYILFDNKWCENRPRKQSYRGRLFIHSSKEWHESSNGYTPGNGQCGVILGSVDLVDVVDLDEVGSEGLKKIARSHGLSTSRECMAHVQGPMCLVVKDPQALKTPIEASGMLGIWRYRARSEQLYFHRNRQSGVQTESTGSPPEWLDATVMPIDERDRDEVIAVIRDVFSTGGLRSRDEAIRDIAHALG